MPFHGHVVCVALGRRCARRTASGGKYWLPSTTTQRSLSASTAPFQIALGMSSSRGGSSLVGEREDPVRERDQPVGFEALHDRGERLMAGAMEHQAVGVEVADGDRSALLRDELQQPLAGR